LPSHAGLPSHVWARPGTSDLQAFRQIFCEREYAPLDQLQQVDTILDLGANVGYSSFYFLSRFPDARVLAVEPDPANFDLLGLNLAAFGVRKSTLRAGVWDATGFLSLNEAPYRSGGAWSRQVRISSAEEPGSFPAIDVKTLMDRAGFNRVSLLKMDIEGAEAVVFAAPDVSWLDRVDNIAIELHDDSRFGEASPGFWKAVVGRGFEFDRSGELTLCFRRRPRDDFADSRVGRSA
jgi:FkbM family methyltransferase